MTARIFFFFNDTATTEIYTLSLHDALPISSGGVEYLAGHARRAIEALDHVCLAHGVRVARGGHHHTDRKSTRLNSSHSQISYAVFCLKKKNNQCAKIVVHPTNHLGTLDLVR